MPVTQSKHQMDFICELSESHCFLWTNQESKREMKLVYTHWSSIARLPLTLAHSRHCWVPDNTTTCGANPSRQPRCLSLRSKLRLSPRHILLLVEDATLLHLSGGVHEHFLHIAPAKKKIGPRLPPPPLSHPSCLPPLPSPPQPCGIARPSSREAERERERSVWLQVARRGTRTAAEEHNTRPRVSY